MRNLLMVIGENGVMGCSKEFMDKHYPKHSQGVLPWMPNDARIFQSFVLRSNSLSDQQTQHMMRGRFMSPALYKFFDGLWGKKSLCTDNNNIAVVSQYGFADYRAATKNRDLPYRVVSSEEVDEVALPLFYKPDLHATHWFMGGVMTIKKLIGLHLGGKCLFDNLVIIQLQQDIEGDLTLDPAILRDMLDSNFTMKAQLQNKSVNIMRFVPVEKQMSDLVRN